MSIDYDKVQSDVRALGCITNNDDFLKGFLAAFDFPSSTYTRLIASRKSGVNQGVHVHGNGGVFFLASTVENLTSEFIILKKNDISKIKEAFIVIVNETDLLAYERDSGNMLESNKSDLYRKIEFFFPLLGIKPNPASDEMKSADRKAAEKFAELYTELSTKNRNRSDDIAVFLCRLLFCCFADNIGVLTKGGQRHLASIIIYTDVSGSDTGLFFSNLFEALKSEKRSSLPGYFSNVMYLDSRLFGEVITLLAFTMKARRLVLDLIALDWSDISPDILGVIIQSIIHDKAEVLCCNYTSTANIHKVIGPLFMDDLYHSFECVKTSLEGCEELLKRVRSISVFDPSCGAGNFLLVAFKELNKLARKISATIQKHQDIETFSETALLLRVVESCPPNEDGTFVSWRNFYGIENDLFSCVIARLGFLFVVCQEARDGYDIKSLFANTLPVLFTNNLVKANATRLDWGTVCDGSGETYLIANPSYVGARKMTPEQKTDFKHVFAGYKNVSNLDYASCWFMLATKYICAHGGGFAFVTTNSLTQGEQVPLLWPKLFEKGVHIRFAYTSFKWTNEARNRTAVSVVVIGVVPNSDLQPLKLFTATNVIEPQCISPYLVPGDTIVKKRTKPISKLPTMDKGNMPLCGDGFLMTHEQKVDAVSEDPRADKFFKRVVGAEEFINGIERWCIWIRDTELHEAMNIPFIADRLEKVKQARLASKQSSTRKKAAQPHRFRETRETHSSSLVVPSVSSENRVYIPIGFVDKNVIVTNLAFVIYDCEPWIFGVVASKMHNVWVMTVCGELETRNRYSSRLGYNTFPFPDICKEQKVEILQRVLAVIDAREKYTGMTYAELYDSVNMPDELRQAHQLLDCVIDRFYRDAPFVSDQDRLDCLFELYKNLGG
jgi:hypothetical protein